MNFTRTYYTLLVFLTVIFQTYAQEEMQSKFVPHHTLGLIISHTNVSKGVDINGDRKWLSLPSWAINYNYKFSPHWAIGLHNDIVTETFEVEEHLSDKNVQTIERSYPLASVLMASYKPGKHFSYLFGAGGEFSHTGHLFLWRVGVEYGYEINEKWEINANLTNDLKVYSYNSWAIGLGITKVLN
jgi:hypothetical protein